MDQHKLQKLLRLLMMLSGNRFYSLAHIMGLLESSGRTIYRYLETFETAGFILEREKGSYRLKKDASSNHSLQRLLHFSEEEAMILYETLDLIEGTSPVKEQLIRKLNLLYDYKVLEQIQQTDDLAKIKVLSEAMRNKKVVHLKSYRSSNSDKISDRMVEPFDYVSDYRAVWCYEYESNSCKQFRLARIQEVETTSGNWENEALHKVWFTDAFRISGESLKEQIKVSLSLKAYNLLLEEFPLSREYIEDKKGSYLLNIPVAGYPGIGRFVLGLPGEVKVLGPEKFKEFLKNERKKIFY